MRVQTFDRIIKPVAILVLIVIIPVVSLTVLEMWSKVYEDTSYTSTILSLNDTHIVFDDGNTVPAAMSQTDGQCFAGQTTKVHTQDQMVSVRCGSDLLTFNPYLTFEEYGSVP